MKSILWGLFYACALASNSYAEMVMPPPSSSAKERKEYLHQLNLTHPWITSNGRMTKQSMEGYLENEQRLLDELKQNAAFRKEAARRQKLTNLRIRSYEEIDTEEYLLEAKWSKALTLKNKTTLVQLATELKELLQNIERNPLNSILVGILKSLPTEAAQAGFKISDMRKKITYVQEELKKTSDESLRTTFQGERYGLTGETWGAQEVLKLLDNSLQASRILFEKSIQYLSATRISEGKQGELAFSGPEEITQEIESIIDENISGKTNWKLIRHEFSLWVGEYFSLQKSKKRSVAYEIFLEEIPPYVATFRGSITGDCSTTHSGLFPYSPFERNFLIREDGNVIAHASGTYVQAGKERVFYLHDLRGMEIDAEGLDLVLVALLDHPEVLNVKTILLPTKYRRDSIDWGTDLVDAISQPKGGKAISYYPADREIRAIIGKYYPYGIQYDGPAHNRTAVLPRKKFPRGDIGNTEILSTSENGDLSEQPPAARALTLMRNLINGIELPDSIPAKEQKDLKTAVRALGNPKKLPLAEYYQSAAVALNQIGLNLSNNFFKDNPVLFEEGHFRASDVYEADNDEMQKRSSAILYGIFFRDLERAAKIMKSFGSEWIRTSPLQKLLQQMLEERGAVGLARIGDLIRMGAPIIPALAGSAQSRALLFQTGFKAAQYEMLTFLQEQGQLDLTAAEWDHTANLLDNEDKNSDENWSMLAAQLLANATPVPDSEIVRTQILRSVKDEKNKKILIFTSIALLRSGIQKRASKSEMKAYYKAAFLVGQANRPKYVSEPIWEEAFQAIDEDVVANAGKIIARDNKAKEKEKAKGKNCAENVVAANQRGNRK